MDAYVAQHGIDTKPGIFELLDYMDEAGIPGAITSSSPMSFIEQHLSDANLLHRFRKLCSGHSIPNGKPAPDIYLLGAKELELKPEECLALEDSPTGILSAYRAGCLPVFVPDQDEADETTQAMLYGRIDSLTDIMDISVNDIVDWYLDSIQLDDFILAFKNAITQRINSNMSYSASTSVELPDEQAILREYKDKPKDVSSTKDEIKSESKRAAKSHKNSTKRKEK
jgi:hypothetical protein